MVEYIVEAISTLEWPANATAITRGKVDAEHHLCVTGKRLSSHRSVRRQPYLSYSKKLSIAMTSKHESLLLRLPLELRQRIYEFIFGPQRLVKLSHIRLQLDDWVASMIYRSQSEKMNESKGWQETKDVHDGFEEERSESDVEGAHSLSTKPAYEWRTGVLEVSRAMSNEASDVLYGRNIFVMDLHTVSYCNFLQLNVANLRRIRYLGIVILPRGVSFGEPFVFESQL